MSDKQLLLRPILRKTADDNRGQAHIRLGTWLALLIGVDRNTHESRREALETEARRGISQVRPTEAYVQSVEKAGR
jgi:hypothetical protein